ncbi:MAG TPA: rhomboid family intramembrane serine protease [Bacteroidia bacterium]|nr:rhomboid family intramembrane serine protease [Bacteroidia bacterium]
MASLLIRIYDVKKNNHTVLLRELFPFTFVVLLWIIQLVQAFLQTSWADYSLYPRSVHGLIGIFTAPLLHANFGHLTGNTIPLLFLGYLLFNSYREIAGKIFLMIYFLTGILDWFLARSAFHLGASGVVYGLATFLFFSGLIRKNPPLMVISLLVVFLYGSLVWGVFPIDPQVSWESHLYGALTGAILSVVYRREGPQPKKYFEDEKEEEENGLPENFNPGVQHHGTHNPQMTQEAEPFIPADPLFPRVIIRYDYTEKKKGEGNEKKEEDEK